VTKTYVNGRVHIRKSMCDTCIFRPGNLMHLDEGRRDKMVEGAVRNESCIPCHSHLYQGEAVEPVCRGFYDRHPTKPIIIAEMIGVVEWVE
jgi:uncharacterized protein (UPF0179 family)